MRLASVSLTALILSGCATSPVERSQPALAAPRTCAVFRGAYCIEAVGLTVETSELAGGSASIKVYEHDWRMWPLVITEPRGCRSGTSNTIELLSTGRSGGSISMLVRLRRDGTCDLLLSAPDRSSDSSGSAFFTGMTQIRACASRTCEGTVIGGQIRSRIDWNPNSIDDL